VTFLFPWFFAVAVAAAAAAVGLHFIVMRQAPREMFPTARFVPDRELDAPAIGRRPADLVLLALRVALLLLIGAAFARPVVPPRRVPLYRIVAVDSGSISTALVRALRSAAEARERADSLELTVVSPLTRDRFDAATDSIRALWPGAITVDTAPPRPPLTARPAIVHWPADAPAPGTTVRARIDTVGALVAGDLVVVAPFERRWRFDSVPASARVVARWVDGEPAAIEDGCERDVAVAVPTGGDIVLRPAFRRFVEAMHAPCGGTPSPAAAAADIEALRGRGPTRVSARAVQSATIVPAPLLPWLLGAAIVLAFAELAVRRRA
jgi:hypothetical protein